MFMRAVAIYEKDQSQQFVLKKSAIAKSEKSYFMEKFTERVLPEILKDLDDKDYSITQDDDTYHYARYHKDNRHLCLIVTSRQLDPVEAYYLLINTNHIDRRSEIVKASLEDIVDQTKTLRFTGKNLLIETNNDSLAELKTQMAENVIPKMLERGEQVKELEESSVKLMNTATLFNNGATNLQYQTGCCGSTVSTVRSTANSVVQSMPSMPTLNPVPSIPSVFGK